MLKKIFLLLLTIALFQQVFAAKNDSLNYKHRWFVYWGYNREFFSTSNINLKGTSFDLNFYQVKAKDKPYPFNLKNYVDPNSITVAQYDYRMGYSLNEKIGFSFGLDHMKYILDNSQFARVSGYINADPKFSNPTAQTFDYSKPTELTKDFLYLTHTNGLNLISVDMDYRSKLLHNHFIKINLNSGFGVAGMVTRTQVRLEGFGHDNYFHLCGYAASTYQGLEFIFGKYFFIRPQIRLGWVNLPTFLIDYKASPDRGKQNFAFVEAMVVAGSYFNWPTFKKHR